MLNLEDLINSSRRIVFFGGAGVSTESGIPDFRSQDGLYHQQYDYPPETILSHTFYKRYPEEFFRFYKDKLLPLDAKPNQAHLKLAEMEEAGRLSAIVTQNIDGLHQKAGSKKVYELHGSVYRNHCEVCRKFYPPEFIRDSLSVPTCSCGGRIKPDVVLYEEGLDEDVLKHSIQAIAGADLMIVAGTSLTVYPAAGLLRYFRGSHLVLINKAATAMDQEADLVLHEAVGEVLGKVHVKPLENGI